MTLTENSSVKTSDTQGPWKYKHHWEIAVGTHVHAQHGAKPTLVFSPADAEASWLLHLFDLLTIWWHSATRKHLFLYLQGDRPGLRKPKRDNQQH